MHIPSIHGYTKPSNREGGGWGGDTEDKRRKSEHTGNRRRDKGRKRERGEGGRLTMLKIFMKKGEGCKR